MFASSTSNFGSNGKSNGYGRRYERKPTKEEIQAKRAADKASAMKRIAKSELTTLEAMKERQDAEAAIKAFREANPDIAKAYDQNKQQQDNKEKEIVKIFRQTLNSNIVKFAEALEPLFKSEEKITHELFVKTQDFIVKDLDANVAEKQFCLRVVDEMLKEQQVDFTPESFDKPFEFMYRYVAAEKKVEEKVEEKA